MLHIFLFLSTASSCLLSTQSPGVCVSSSSISLSFCADEVQDKVCIPAIQDTWMSWNSTAKDNTLSQVFLLTLETKLKQETSSDLSPIFTRNKNCISAFKRLICLSNFPSCSDSVAYPICEDICTTYSKECQIVSNDYCDDIILHFRYNSTECSYGYYISYILVLILGLVFSLVFNEFRYLSSISVAVKENETGDLSGIS